MIDVSWFIFVFIFFISVSFSCSCFLEVDTKACVSCSGGSSCVWSFCISSPLLFTCRARVFISSMLSPLFVSDLCSCVSNLIILILNFVISAWSSCSCFSVLVSASRCSVLYSSTSLFRSVFISSVWLCARGAFLFPGLSLICIISWILFVVTIARFGRSVVCLFVLGAS